MLTKKRVLELFEEERDLFAKTFPDVDDVGLKIVARHFKKNPIRRDLAWYDTSDRCVYLVKSGLERSLACLRGVIRHELGHAADVKIKESGAEARADKLAFIATKHPILYTEEGLQHTTHGKEGRPKWLHQ